MIARSRIAYLILIFNFVNEICNNELNTKLEFARYSYTRNSQIENRIKILQNSCGTKTECFNLDTSIDKQNCILKCISRKCYEEIYEFDPLEEGEIDQRYSSFKGCFAHDRE